MSMTFILRSLKGVVMTTNFGGKVGEISRLILIGTLAFRKGLKGRILKD